MSQVVPSAVLAIMIGGCSASTEVETGSWIAVGEDGALFTSPDAVSWTLVDTGTQRDLHAVASGDGKLVAVGEGMLLVSDDTETWRDLADENSNNLSFSFADFDGEVFFAAGNYISAAPPPNNIAPEVFRLRGETWVAEEAPDGAGSSLTAFTATPRGMLSSYRIDAFETQHAIAAREPGAATWSREFMSSAHRFQAVSWRATPYAFGDCTVFDGTATKWTTVHVQATCDGGSRAAIAESASGVVVAVSGQSGVRFDTEVWSDITLPAGAWSDVHVAGQTFVIVGRDTDDVGMVAVSEDDGVSWRTTATVDKALFGVTTFVD